MHDLEHPLFMLLWSARQGLATPWKMETTTEISGMDWYLFYFRSDVLANFLICNRETYPLHTT